jgi:hypothetical protein
VRIQESGHLRTFLEVVVVLLEDLFFPVLIHLEIYFAEIKIAQVSKSAVKTPDNI